MLETDIFKWRCALSGQWRDDGTCSFCGSLRPSRVLELIRSGRAEIEPTDKNYKLYIRADGLVLPTSKVYMNHFSEVQAVEFVTLKETGRMRVGYPGRFYSGLALGDYKEAIMAAVNQIRTAAGQPPVAQATDTPARYEEI